MKKYHYYAKITLSPKCEDFEIFRYFRHRLACLGHTRPDILAPVNTLSQTTAATFELKHLNWVNSVVRRVK